jgi:hypothetical protein
LLRLFAVETADFWKHHYQFDEPSSKPATALGEMRIREILINTVFPIALLYARIFKDQNVRTGTLDVYRTFPASENNALTRTMECQLVKNRLASSVCIQQAVIHLYKYYCIEKRCGECEIGKALSKTKTPAR